MNQLFPIKVRTTAPSPFGNSADLKIVAIGEDGLDYAVKTGVIAASEFLCYKIYQACGVGVPQYAILEMPDTTFAFGSCVVSGVNDFSVCQPIEKIEWFKACALIISSICSLDFLVANNDRHEGNFLFICGLNGRKTCLAIDFSRAFLYHSWPLPNIWNDANNTTTMVKGLRNMSAWDSSSASQSLLSASAIQSATWEGWVDSIPDGWLTLDTKSMIRDWWAKGEFQKRLQKCMDEVK